MDYNQNAGSCGAGGQQYPTVYVGQAQPEPICPSPGIVRLPTQTQGTVFESPSRTCRLELGDLSGNTAVRSFLVIGGDGCTDAEIRDDFELSVDMPIIRVSGHCNALSHQTVTGAFTSTITGGASEEVRTTQYNRNAQQNITTVTEVNNCAFKLTRDFRCFPCDNGELIQSFGTVNCAPIVVGPQYYFGYQLEAGIILEDAVICICSYSVDSLISCIAPPVCPPMPPAPPAPNYGYGNQGPVGQAVNGNGQFVNRQF